MSEQYYNPIIPLHSKGKSLDIEEHKADTSQEIAMKTFDRAKFRLLNPAIWQSLAGAMSASFLLFSKNNTSLHRLAEIGDFCRIDIIGPDAKRGDGYDWVKVAAIQNNSEKDADESIAILLVTSNHPTDEVNKTAHFFEAQASSTFIIKRKGNNVTASYHGRNEVANTNDVSMVDKVRNLLIATGAEAGLSKLQWKALLEGLLQPAIDEQDTRTASSKDSIF